MTLGGLAQSHHSVFISELMVDPSPSVGLPPYEWIEIRNGSDQPLQLQNWRLGTSTALSGPLPFYWLAPDSLLILCSSSAWPSLSVLGRAIAVVGFPSLDNDGTTVWLRHPSGSTIHGISYDKKWHGNSLKAEGGWSLEMIDQRWPCSGKNNWRSSTHIRGGTPGSINSVQDLQTELTLPTAIHAYALATDIVRIQLSGSLDSAWSVRPSLYRVSGSIEVIAVKTVDPLHTIIECKLNRPLQADTLYTLVLTAIKSCHSIGSSRPVTLKTGLASICKPLDIVINEVLFNPRSGGSDFAELYNNSNRIVDLSTLYIANRQPGGTLGPFFRLSATPRLIFPDEYVAFSNDPALIRQQYLVVSTTSLLQTAGFPSLPDDQGQLVLLEQQGSVIDELQYNEDWHFPLLQDKEGVSLERINPNERTQWSSNWHSAAKTEGFATPTRKNSQYVPLEQQTSFLVKTQLITPNLDGLDDFCVITYSNKQPGTLASIQILDAAGRLIRVVATKTLLGSSGQWYWDGRDQQGILLAAANYLIVVTHYSIQGDKKLYRFGVTLWR